MQVYALCSQVGLDSSILSKIAKDNIDNLTTFSIDYIGNDGNIIEYEEKIRQSEEIIRQEKTKIKQYKKAISLLEEEMERNGEDVKLLGECTERIKQYHSRYKFVSVQFLLRLSKIKNVPMDKLNQICLFHEFEMRSIKEPKK